MRSLCEKSKVAAALPCYADNERELAQLIDEEMRAADLTIAADAHAALLEMIGGDRLASRNEIRKLVLYAKDQKNIELADVMAIVADASQIALDGLIDAVFAGKPRKPTSNSPKRGQAARLHQQSFRQQSARSPICTR